VLIDIDHYWDFLHRNGFKDYSIKRMFAYHSVLFNRYLHHPGFLGLSVFHTAEFLLLFFLAAVVYDSTVMMVIFWGMLFHLVLDVLYLVKYGAVFKRAFSIVEYFVRKRSMVRCGLFPDSVYQEALTLSEAMRFKPGLLGFLQEAKWGGDVYHSPPKSD
jgi:hypothetical protein